MPPRRRHSAESESDSSEAGNRPQESEGQPIFPGSWIPEWQKKVGQTRNPLDPALLTEISHEVMIDKLRPIDGEDGRFFETKEVAAAFESHLSGDVAGENALNVLRAHVGPGGQGFPLKEQDVKQIDGILGALDALEELGKIGPNGYVTDYDLEQAENATQRMAGAHQVHGAIRRVLRGRPASVTIMDGVYDVGAIEQGVLECAEQGTYGVDVTPEEARNVMQFVHSNYAIPNDNVDEIQRQHEMDQLLSLNNHQPPQQTRRPR